LAAGLRLDSFGQVANVKELAIDHHASIPDHALKLSDVTKSEQVEKKQVTSASGTSGRNKTQTLVARTETVYYPDTFPEPIP
jgi:hypothetical protein